MCCRQRAPLQLQLVATASDGAERGSITLFYGASVVRRMVAVTVDVTVLYR